MVQTSQKKNKEQGVLPQVPTKKMPTYCQKITSNRHGSSL